MAGAPDADRNLNPRLKGASRHNLHLPTHNPLEMPQSHIEKDIHMQLQDRCSAGSQERANHGKRKLSHASIKQTILAIWGGVISAISWPEPSKQPLPISTWWSLDTFTGSWRVGLRTCGLVAIGPKSQRLFQGSGNLAIPVTLQGFSEFKGSGSDP